jgi:malonyl CoA-acyl carrier protein transacylase/phosphopantetheinyl transferase
VRAFRDALTRHPRAPLCTLAAAAARDSGTAPCRLALIAADREDLAAKLARATERLEAGRADFRLRSGVFAAEGPTPGRLAFIFPGEGAQYQGMLAEILMTFPEARSWFDFWDGLFPDRALPPSASVFPPPSTLSPALARDLSDRLFGLELGSESVFIAAQALMAVLSRLGIVPDVLLGHSSGEHAALAAAGVFGPVAAAGEGRDAFAGRIRALNRLYQAIDASGGIRSGALLTVGGVDRATILARVEADPDLHLALDNCTHQAVLFGDRPRMEALAAELRALGGITAFLPFDRPYHTPLFSTVADQVAEVYGAMDFRPPARPVWSCMTAAPMPENPILIREVAAGQWAARVRSHETVTALHEDGIRLFLEVGPSANLTGFVEDALNGRPLLALSLDSRRRGRLAHLLQALGRLWVAGRDIRLPALFDGRAIPALDLATTPRPDRTRVIDNTLPFIRLPEDVAADLAARLASTFGAAAPPAPPAGIPEPGPQELSPGGDFFAVMRQFLTVQGQVMTAALGRSTPVLAETESNSTEIVWSPPLLHRIETEAGHLRAETDFDPLADPFLAQHVLYSARVSDTDPVLQALPVLPLAVSLEMAVEAAAMLTGIVGGRLERVRARDWIAFDDGPATLTTEATLLPGGTAVAVRILRGESLLFEAEVHPRSAEPEPLPPLACPQAPLWQDADLYTTGMFHGPLFQGIRHLAAWEPATGGTGGLDADLRDLPLGGFLADGTDPQGLLLNPALLDQIGHVTDFWIAQGAGTDFSSFPSSIDRIDLWNARAEAVAGVRLSGRIGFRDAADNSVPGPQEARFLQGDFLCTDAEGAPLFRASGWRDRFFRVPHSFYQARFRPREAWYGAPLAGSFDAGSLDAGDLVLWSVPAFPPGFLEDAGGIWMRVLAATVLSASERATWRALTGPARRRRDWLMGRLALKEAARAFLLARDGVALLPADLVIVTTPEGKPRLDAGALAARGLGALPELSLSHSAGAALAVAAPPGQAVGIDMEQLGAASPELLAEGAFSPAEQGLLGPASPESLLAGWCAKEALAKALGEGLAGRPRAFVLSAFDGTRARIVAPSGSMHDVTLARQGGTVMALARITAPDRRDGC